MIKTSVKAYNVRSSYDKGRLRYSITCNGQKILSHHEKKDLAIKQALAFCQTSYKDSVKLDDVEIKLTFD